MPTQEQIDQKQTRTKSRSGTIGTTVRSGGIFDISTSNKLPAIQHTHTGSRGIIDDGIDFVIRDRAIDDDGEGGGIFELDVVLDDNTAGRASFNGSGII